MQTPARGEDCRHLNCFDLLSFLTMNRLRPNWKCPICMKDLSILHIRIDE